MNLCNMSREELIKELKRHLILCKNTITLEYTDVDDMVLKTTFTKGEYYRCDNNEGGTWIEKDEEYFDIFNPEYKDVLYEGFFKK